MKSRQTRTDQELLQMLIRGDKHAFEIIYLRYAAELNRFAFGKCGDRDHGKEIVQEIFVWLWTSRQDLQKIKNLRTYLFTTAKNRLLTHYRASSARDKHANSFANLDLNSDVPFDRQLEAADFEQTVMKMLSAMPPKCQVAFRLNRLEQLPISTVAKEMSLCRHTVEKYLSKALTRLRKNLENHR
jgi:RNA polymerase sigma-70 factor (ECF subfamily)